MWVCPWVELVSSSSRSAQLSSGGISSVCQRLSLFSPPGELHCCFMTVGDVIGLSPQLHAQMFWKLWIGNRQSRVDWLSHARACATLTCESVTSGVNRENNLIVSFQEISRFIFNIWCFPHFSGAELCSPAAQTHLMLHYFVVCGSQCEPGANEWGAHTETLMNELISVSVATEGYYSTMFNHVLTDSRSAGEIFTQPFNQMVPNWSRFPRSRYFKVHTVLNVFLRPSVLTF